jgi:hypothetical protein
MDGAEIGKTVDPRYRSAHDAGAGLGVMIMLVFWAAGAVVFGLLAHFTRGKRELLEVETVVGRVAAPLEHNDAALCSALVPTLPSSQFLRRYRTGQDSNPRPPDS